MLGSLFGSNSRVKMLKLFLLNPEKKFYIRQLARDLKLQINSVRRELENLEKFGLLVSNFGDSAEAGDEKSGGQEKKYYRANKDFVLFGEIKDLIVKAQVLYGEDFINKLKRVGSLRLVIFTGMFVNQSDSSVDLLVVGRANRHKFLKLIKELEEELGREINFTLMDSNDFKYRREMTDVFLYNILEGKKIVALDEIGGFLL